MAVGWCFLGAMIVAYGAANFLQSIAAGREKIHDEFHPRLLLRLASHRTYVTGIACQVLGFLLAIAARADLPLFLVQAAAAAGLGVTALLGVVVLRWRLPRAEIALLVALTLGIAALVVSAQPSESKDLSRAAIVGLAGTWVAISASGWFAARKLRGVPGSLALGGLAGLAFGAAAVASRPLASVVDVTDTSFHPLLCLIIVQSLTGQLFLAMAMQRGSTTAAVASMDAAFAAPAAVVGLVLLGDQIRPGLEWLAAVGFFVTLGAVLAMTRYAQPQPEAALVESSKLLRDVAGTGAPATVDVPTPSAPEPRQPVLNAAGPPGSTDVAEPSTVRTLSPALAGTPRRRPPPTRAPGRRDAR